MEEDRGFEILIILEDARSRPDGYDRSAQGIGRWAGRQARLRAGLEKSFTN